MAFITDTDKLRAAFEAKTANNRADYDKSGVGAALDGLQRMIAATRAGGFDIALEMKGWPSQGAYDMAPTAANCRTVADGVLKVGQMSFHVAVMDKYEGSNTVVILLAEFEGDSRGAATLAATTSARSTYSSDVSGTVRTRHRSTAYHFSKDPDVALTKMQDRIMTIVAHDALIREYSGQDIATRKDVPVVKLDLK